VLAEYKKIASTKVDPGVLLKAKFKLPFYNTSRWTFASLIGDPEGVADNLVDYIAHFSPNVRDVFDGYWLRQSLRRADPCIACVEELSAVATGGSRWPLILMW
jgi:type I restriction enzyme M protein